MKLNLVLLSASMCIAIKSAAQLSDTTTIIRFRHRPSSLRNDTGMNRVYKSSRSTRDGKTYMAIGGTCVAAGTLGFLSIDKENEKLYPLRSAGFYTALIGTPVLVAGIIMYAIGTAHDTRHQNRLTLTGSPNKIGVAYNF